MSLSLSYSTLVSSETFAVPVIWIEINKELPINGVHSGPAIGAEKEFQKSSVKVIHDEKV